MKRVSQGILVFAEKPDLLSRSVSIFTFSVDFLSACKIFSDERQSMQAEDSQYAG